VPVHRRVGGARLRHGAGAMNTHFVALLGLLGFSALGAYRAAAGGEGDADDAEATPPVALAEDRYFTARKDLEGGGYLLQDVNLDVPARHAAALDLAAANLDPDATRAVDDAPDGDLVLYGSLAASAPGVDTENLIVKVAYRGLPGMAPAPGDGFFVVRDRQPSIGCGVAPGDDSVAARLDTGDTSDVTTVAVARAAAPRVDEAWLASRVRRHGAVVAAQLRDGVLEVSQVFLRLPDDGGPCLLIRHVCNAPLHATYTRDPNRCLVFDHCVAPRPCSFLRPGPCADGYRQVSWPADNAQCVAFACDPAFLAE